MVRDLGARIGLPSPPSRTKSPRYFRKNTDDRRFGNTKHVPCMSVAR